MTKVKIDRLWRQRLCRECSIATLDVEAMDDRGPVLRGTTR